MTAGDVVNVSMTGVNSYVPAAGVEIVVLMNMTASSSFYFGHQTAAQATAAYLAASSTTVNYINPTLGNKLGITNTNYYYNSSANGLKGFSGIQTK